MDYFVRNLRRARPVSDPDTGIVLQGKLRISRENMLKLARNPVIAEMLGFDETKQTFAGSELMTVEEAPPVGPVAAATPKPSEPSSAYPSGDD